MNQLDKQVRYPRVALFVYFAIGTVLYMYGIRDGSLLILALIAGIFLYKLLTARS